MSTEMDPVIKATAATFRYLAGWFGTEEQQAGLLERALDVETADEHRICCPVCQEVTCDEGCPLEPVRARWDAEALSLYRQKHDPDTKGEQR